MTMNTSKIKNLMVVAFLGLTSGFSIAADAPPPASAAPSAENPATRLSPPATSAGTIGQANVTINYGSPSVRGRKIWGALVPYSVVWRSGANEATTFETDKDLKIEGKTLPKGKYAFFTIPTETKWTIIFNKVPDQWGAFHYEQSKDILRVKVSSKKSTEMKERLEYAITDGKITLMWENLEVPISVSQKK